MLGGRRKEQWSEGKPGKGFRRQSTAFNDAFFRSGKKASAYATNLEAQPPDTIESFKDLYRNITAKALKVHLGHFFYSSH